MLSSNIIHYLPLLSIALEVAVAILGILIGLQKKQFGWFIALTFTIYVIYDLSRYLTQPVNESVLRIVFFIASTSILVAVWQIYRHIK